MANAVMHHKSFVGPTMYWNLRSLNDNREAIRAQAEAFMNLIGAENVVSVAEHAMSFGPFSVVVWYRVEEPVPNPSPQLPEPPRMSSSAVKNLERGPGT